MNAQRPTLRDKVKTADFLTSIGFTLNELSPAPSSCHINRYAFELFFEYSRHSRVFKILSSDHIEHGFKIIAEAAQSQNLRDLSSLVNHIFIFAFIEILLADKSERAALFIKRQSHLTSLSKDNIDQLLNVKSEMIDSLPIIFDNMMGPLQFEFGAEFYQNLDQFIDESTAPAIGFLLRPFFHIQNSKKTEELPVSNEIMNRPTELWGKVEQSPEFFPETPVPTVSPVQHTYAQFKMTKDIPTLVISKPKYIPPQMPTITCLNAPRYVESAALSKQSLEFIYSVDSKLYYCSPDCSKPLYTHINAISAVDLSDCGNWALSCDIGGEIHVIHTKQNNRSSDYQPIKSCITCCAFSPKIAHQFIIGTMIGEVILYSVSKREIQRVFIGHSKGIIAIKIHPNSEYAASISLDTTIRVWSISMGCCVRLFKAAGNLPTSIHFSHSGQWIVNTATDGNVSIYDIGTGRLVKAFKVYDNPVIDAIFSQNDQLIIGFDRMGNFFFWDTNERYGSQIASVRIDRVRIAAIECLSTDEIRIVGCSKQANVV